jgi:RyR domain
MNTEQLAVLAEAIHEHYRATMANLGHPTGSRLATAEWDELTTPQQEANRAQARAVDDKLDIYDLYVVDVAHPEAAELVWSPEQVERLARVEHDRWMYQKLESGWRHGTPRSDEDKIHPLIKPYDELTEAEKDLDREPVRQIPHLLALAGLAIRGPAAD